MEPHVWRKASQIRQQPPACAQARGMAVWQDTPWLRHYAPSSQEDCAMHGRHAGALVSCHCAPAGASALDVSC
jgi:hypothetical protein